MPPGPCPTNHVHNDEVRAVCLLGSLSRSGDIARGENPNVGVGGHGGLEADELIGEHDWDEVAVQPSSTLGVGVGGVCVCVCVCVG